MQAGDQLAGRYRLDRQLGRGGMGEVWRAFDTMLDRAVAVKTVLESVASEEAVVRFRREATIGARLQHPGITVVHDVGQEEGKLFIVMELLSGEDLGDALAREPGGLPVAVAVDLAAQCAEALAAAHELGVVHRDLKPSNLFLLPAGRLKICDFGIAHSADATAGWTVTGRGGPGSPPYMAPEQWRGEHVDARCDLYALGCVLYALLSGEPPFGQAELGWVLMYRHTAEPPVSLREAGTQVPEELDRLVLRLLEKDPADRPESAAVVAQALRGLLGPPSAASTARPEADSGEPAGPPPPSAPAPGPVSSPAPPDAPPEADAGACRPASASASGSGAEAVPAAVQELVRELLRDAENAMGRFSSGTWGQVLVLPVAADAAARFDAGLALRLLAEAELAAWTHPFGPGSPGPEGKPSGGHAGGTQLAWQLITLAKDIAAHSPARARRLLTDAQQAVFTVSGQERKGPLSAVMEEFTRIAPEQADQIAGYYFADAPERKQLSARIATALAAADPAEAELQLALISDVGLRAAATYDMVLAVAARDLSAALRMSERIGSSGGRLLALCQVTSDRAEAQDAAGAARVLEQAEEELPRFLEERAAWLRDEAALHARHERLVQAEQLRHQAAALLRGRPEDVADEKVGHGLDSLARARESVERAMRRGLDPAVARERADRARNLPDPFSQALELARIAQECVATGRTPWLVDAVTDAGPPPSLASSRAGRPEPARHRPAAARGARAWHMDTRPDSVYAAGAHVVWLSGTEVGCVRADGGSPPWTAYADEGAAAPRLPEGGRLLVSCAADAATVYVEVRRDGTPGVRLLAREPRDGRVRWWRDLPERRPLHGVGSALLHGAPDDLTALAAETGDVLWQRSLPDPGARSPKAVGDCLLLKDSRLLQALHLPTGRTVWSWSVEPPAHHVVYGKQDLGEGPVHFLDGPFLIALLRSSGRHLWRFEVGPAAEGPLVEGGTVYVAAYDPGRGQDRVLALDAGTGALRWQRALARHGGPRCTLSLLGLRAGALYVTVRNGGRRGLLGRGADPFVAVLDAVTGRTVREWPHPGSTDGEVLLAGENLVLSRPTLSAYALP